MSDPFEDEFDELDEDLDGMIQHDLELLNEHFGLLDGTGAAARAFSLTVAESKRLIARGIAADGRVMTAMQEGMVAVGKGTTNAYVLEELLGERIEKGKYVLGRTVPEGDAEAQRAFEGSLPEVVFRDGEPVPGLTVAEAVGQMSQGDVVLKGANALDYRSGLAGVLIGHPAGGTLGSILGHVYGKGLHLIVPVGLEKQVATPLSLSRRVAPPSQCAAHDIPRLWPFQASLFTEIEALWILAGVQAHQIGAGGVCGAEGAVWLMVTGLEEEVEEASEIVAGLRGEPSFLDAALGK